MEFFVDSEDGFFSSLLNEELLFLVEIGFVIEIGFEFEKTV